MIPYVRAEFETMMNALATEVIENARIKYSRFRDESLDPMLNKELDEKLSIIDDILRKRSNSRPDSSSKGDVR